MQRLAAIVLVCLLVYPALTCADVIKVIVLGTGGPRPDAQRAGPGVLIEVAGHNMLFDAGRGVTTRLWEANYGPGDISRVFLTHLHADHLVGLADLWLTGWIWQRPSSLQLMGPKGTEAYARQLQAAYEFDRNVRSSGPHGLEPTGGELQSADIEQGVVYDEHGIRVTAFRVDHGRVRPAFGYRVEYAGHSVVISGDTRPSKNLVRHARGADLLIHEVAAARAGLAADNPRLQGILDYHTTPGGLADVLGQARPRLTILTHLVLFGIRPDAVIGQIEAEYQGNVRVGEDLLWIDVGDRIVVRGPAQTRAAGP